MSRRTPEAATLRVIDFGRVSALRSQTLWHAVAHGVSAGEPPTLSFVRPAEPYVCLGYHRRLDEVDQAYCTAEGLPIYRRMVGGGPVYLDADQLFFQICLPAGSVSPARTAALRDLLTPALGAYRAAGVAAELDDNMEITVGEAKICGHGAGQVENAVVVCGNLIERFDHERATSILRLPDPTMRAEVLRMMRRFVNPTPADPEEFQRAAVEAYAGALGLTAEPGELTELERAAVEELDEQFTSESWIAGPQGRRRPPAREVKIRAGVWVFAAEHEDARVVASVVGDSVERARFRTSTPSDDLYGDLRAAEAAMAGVTLAKAPAVLAGFGSTGRQLAAAFAAADGKSL